MLVWAEKDNMTISEAKDKIEEISGRIKRRGYEFDGLKVIGEHLYFQYRNLELC